MGSDRWQVSDLEAANSPRWQPPGGVTDPAGTLPRALEIPIGHYLWPIYQAATNPAKPGDYGDGYWTLVQ